MYLCCIAVLGQKCHVINYVSFHPLSYYVYCRVETDLNGDSRESVDWNSPVRQLFILDQSKQSDLSSNLANWYEQRDNGM